MTPGANLSNCCAHDPCPAPEECVVISFDRRCSLIPSKGVVTADGELVEGHEVRPKPRLQLRLSELACLNTLFQILKGLFARNVAIRSPRYQRAVERFEDITLSKTRRSEQGLR